MTVLEQISEDAGTVSLNTTRKRFNIALSAPSLSFEAVRLAAALLPLEAEPTETTWLVRDADLRDALYHVANGLWSQGEAYDWLANNSGHLE